MEEKYNCDFCKDAKWVNDDIYGLYGEVIDQQVVKCPECNIDDEFTRDDIVQSK